MDDSRVTSVNFQELSDARYGVMTERTVRRRSETRPFFHPRYTCIYNERYEESAKYATIVDDFLPLCM